MNDRQLGRTQVRNAPATSSAAFLILASFVIFIASGCRGYECRDNDKTRADLHVIQLALDVIAEKAPPNFSPPDFRSLRAYLRQHGFLIAAESPGMADQWGTEYRATWSSSKQGRTIEVSSAGADRQFDTADDLKARVLIRMNRAADYSAPSSPAPATAGASTASPSAAVAGFHVISSDTSLISTDALSDSAPSACTSLRPAMIR